MKYPLLILSLILSLTLNAQINSFAYTQPFSNTQPANFTSTTSGWSFTNNDNGNSQSKPYSAKLIKPSPLSAKYIYIKINVQEDYTYSLLLSSKHICRIKLSTNETADQTTLLETTTIDLANGNANLNCKGNNWKESSLTYRALYTGIMYFQISVDVFGQDDAYIDDITITETPPISLPITLVYFTGKQIDNSNKINWLTATEINNDYFLLEKTSDGEQFIQVCRINGAGNSHNNNLYEYDDIILFDGILYYKLTQVDYDGKQVSYDLISIDNRLNTPKLKMITNLLGQEVKYLETNTILLYHYDDGTVIRRMLF